MFLLQCLQRRLKHESRQIRDPETDYHNCYFSQHRCARCDRRHTNEAGISASVDFPVVMIRVHYPNSSPTQIEKNIVKPIEEALSTISGIKNMNSSATADGAEIEFEFDWGFKLDLIRTEIGEKVEMVRQELPADVEHINIFNFNSNDIPVVQARVSAPGIDLASNYDLLEKKIKVPIQRIAGVARVDLEGVTQKSFM